VGVAIDLLAPERGNLAGGKPATVSKLEGPNIVENSIYFKEFQWGGVGKGKVYPAPSNLGRKVAKETSKNINQENLFSPKYGPQQRGMGPEMPHKKNKVGRGKGSCSILLVGLQ